MTKKQLEEWTKRIRVLHELLPDSVHNFDLLCANVETLEENKRKLCEAILIQNAIIEELSTTVTVSTTTTKPASRRSASLPGAATVKKELAEEPKQLQNSQTEGPLRLLNEIDLAQVPKYVLGRVDAATVNQGVAEFNRLLALKQKLLTSKRLNNKDSELVDAYKKTALKNEPRPFLNEFDLKRAVFLKQDKRGRVILTVLKMKKMVTVEQLGEHVYYFVC